MAEEAMASFLDKCPDLMWKYLQLIVYPLRALKACFCWPEITLVCLLFLPVIIMVEISLKRK